MQMNRRLYLISGDKEFSNQFSVHILINRLSSFLIIEVNSTVLNDVQIKKYGFENVSIICS